MHDFLKFHHNCDAYMGVPMEQKRTFLTASGEEARSLLDAQYFIAVVSECLCHLSPQNLLQLPDICSG